ncbi:MAG: FMN-binding protein [Treponema sp.]|jgi:uncharacterized protein with FMN-binding domain|nr:FMN-binding protein [Treponema sp.]
MKKAVASMFSILVLFALGLGIVSCATAPAGPSSPYGHASGTAQGQAPGIFGAVVTVTVTLTDGKITEILVDDSTQTPSIGNQAAPIMVPKMVEANSPEVDTVASATVTSQAIIDAVKAAIGQILANQ